jgi:transposase
VRTPPPAPPCRPTGSSWLATIFHRLRAAVCDKQGRGQAVLYYLPKYSPDLNPIEQAFATKLKTLLRKANARSFEAVEAAIAALLNTITLPQHIRRGRSRVILKLSCFRT